MIISLSPPPSHPLPHPFLPLSHTPQNKAYPGPLGQGSCLQPFLRGYDPGKQCIGAGARPQRGEHREALNRSQRAKQEGVPWGLGASLLRCKHAGRGAQSNPEQRNLKPPPATQAGFTGKGTALQPVTWLQDETYMQLMGMSHSSEGSLGYLSMPTVTMPLTQPSLYRSVLQRDLSDVCTKMFPAAYCNHKRLETT